MKNLMGVGVLVLSILFVSCGKEDEGSDSKSFSQRMRDDGITIKTTKSSNSTSQYNSYNRQLEVVIECSSNKSDNYKRISRLNEYLERLSSKAYVKISGRKWDSLAYQNLVMQAINTLQNGAANNSFGNDGIDYSNNYNSYYNQYSSSIKQCPNGILSQGVVNEYFR